MSDFIKQFISILIPDLKKERRHFSRKVKEETLVKQKRKCSICGKHIAKWDIDFDHKNGDCSNNKSSNCQALHASCHRKKHAIKDRNFLWKF